MQSFEDKYAIDPRVSAMESYLALIDFPPYIRGDTQCVPEALVAITSLIQEHTTGEVKIDQLKAILDDPEIMRKYQGLLLRYAMGQSRGHFLPTLR